MRALTWDEVAGAEGAIFHVAREGEPSVELTLEKAVELPSAGRAEGAFRLEFRGPREPLLPQSIYLFTSGDLRHEIFIVPVAQDDGGTLYEAVFN